MGKPNPQNLNPCTPENARERQLKSAQKRKENREKKILMSQIYADFLEKEYNVKTGEGSKKISGAELVNEAMKKVIANGGSPAVSLMKEMREAVEGSKINLSGTVKTEMETTEEREALFEKIVGAE